MCMNGISNALNLFSWLISGLLFLSIFCVTPILVFFIIPVGDGLPYLYYGNPIILLLVFTAYVGHLLAFGVHVSSYFSRCKYTVEILIFFIEIKLIIQRFPALLVIFGILMTNTLTTVLKMYVFKEDNFYLVPYVGIVLPNLLLQQAMEEVNYYETIGQYEKNFFFEYP